MSQALDYAPPSKPCRRYAPILLTVAALALSYALAVPRFKKFRQDQIRRQEIRQQFKEQLELARRAIENNRGTDAALAVLRAEFPTQTERYLFRKSQSEAFQRRIEELRVSLNRAIEAEKRAREDALKEQFRAAIRAAIREDMKKASTDAERASLRRDEDALETAEVMTICCFRVDSADSLRHSAITLLRTGNHQQALAVCERLVRSDPMSRFDSEFWANAHTTR